MRALAAWGIIIILILLGWNQSFDFHWRQVTGKPLTEPAKRTLRTVPYSGAPAYSSAAPTDPAATPQDRSWIFGRTILDPPRQPQTRR